MAFEIMMPRLGWSMEKGKLVEWRKQDGERVETGDVLFLVESDKAIQEVESLESGLLLIPPDSPPLGTEMPVGTLLGYLVKSGEAIPQWPAASSGTVSSETSTPSLINRQIATTAWGVTDTPAISPRARRLAAERGVDWMSLKGSGRTGRIVERDVQQAIATSASVPVAATITPLARRVAQELGVDVERLAVQMPGKRIERADVERAAESTILSKSPAPVSAQDGETSPVTRAPLTQVRMIVAERMSASAHTAAAVTLVTEADATELVRLRSQLKREVEEANQRLPSYNDLLTKLIAQVLTEHPAVNARLEGNQIVYSAAVHIGLAVDTERGLLVPVLRDVHRKTLRLIADESALLIERARSGRLGPDELQGGTFTITNLGMYDIDAFTPIINLPECAILGVGRIMPKPIVIDAVTESYAVRHMISLSLTFDHRVVDGAPAARFLQRVKQSIEHPYLRLVS